MVCIVILTTLVILQLIPPKVHRWSSYTNIALANHGGVSSSDRRLHSRCSWSFCEDGSNSSEAGRRLEIPICLLQWACL